MSERELKRLYEKMKPLATKRMPLADTPHTSGRFGKPLELARVHWVKPELVVAVRFTDWTGDNVIRRGVCQGLREDKPARDVILDRQPRAPATPRPRARPPASTVVPAEAHAVRKRICSACPMMLAAQAEKLARDGE